ncbi:methyltransferase domain-containing protein [Candidatus Daviesbacteria bacterium]|nr:methyltransferase domain-containing protein [Candidatus Daviesbacteria bacterium]
MKEETITNKLACPTDRRPFGQDDISGAEWQGSRIFKARLCCPDCQTAYPIQDGIAFLLPPHLSLHSLSEQTARDEDATGYEKTKAPYETKQERKALYQGVNFSSHTVVVDIGAGPGKRYTHDLAQRAGQVVAIDLSPEMLLLNATIAQTTLPPDVASRIDYVVADATALPLQPKKFDVALFAQVLEHLKPETHVACLTDIKNSLTPEGHLAMSVYNLKATGRDIRRHPADIFSLVIGTFPDEHRGNFRSGYHDLNGEKEKLYYYNFTSPELYQALCKAGFTVDRITGILSLPQQLPSILRAMLDPVLTNRIPTFACNRGQFLVAHATPSFTSIN